MPTYLLTLSLGPVQSLIAAARRTRDLWCGSWLLSEAARAAALELHRQHPGCLIFPDLDNPDQALQPQRTPGDEANIANILRAEVTAASDDTLRALSAAANREAVERLAGLCKQARAEVPDLPLHEDLWQAQTRDILECFAAWTVVADGNYQAAAKRLGGLLAARKATRDFDPAAIDPRGLGYGIPKSSLDAGRESVIALSRKERNLPKYRTALRKLGLNGGEELDALALAKRRAVKAEQFTAFARIAAEPWVGSLTPEQQQRLRKAYQPLASGELATGTTGNQNPASKTSIYAALPYDGALLYGFRLANARQARDLSPDDLQSLGTLDKVLNAIRKEPNAHGELVGEPLPYAAILQADGDRMGKLLTQARGATDSRAISRALHGFASEVREIVRAQRGHAVYAGGDDVLALLPLERAVPCARRLADSFAKRMAGVAERLGLDKEDWPSLSVGLGIGHLMEPLGSLRARADRAERAAKGNSRIAKEQRNALCIHLGVRSGAEPQWRAQWLDQTAFADLERFTQAFRQGALPSRVPYDLRAIAGRLAHLDAWTQEPRLPDPARIETARGIRRSEVARMLERARTERGKPIEVDLTDLIRTRAGDQPLAKLADTLIIARWLSARTAADVGEPA
ncbi:type III-B CRISPR-associated protein Cas10/Cmr2 [uncultured Lamprocystis sp.]|jgi:CRISPR-associated protein Cmr2|uniref:type III-B CRISPR-associated protein Cas10/Cmr2 n=1 Tax=uncultured Lamprocystis sp. TaxID=543132 RepID=UPI0025D4BE6D|nr:type III-B CRISPR-associated protein Cas10/Cmr2 [uncultured Lamprocystis sp.]